jgi:hypothetical protein
VSSERLGWAVRPRASTYGVSAGTVQCTATLGRHRRPPEVPHGTHGEGPSCPEWPRIAIGRERRVPEAQATPHSHAMGLVALSSSSVRQPMKQQSGDLTGIKALGAVLGASHYGLYGSSSIGIIDHRLRLACKTLVGSLTDAGYQLLGAQHDGPTTGKTIRDRLGYLFCIRRVSLEPGDPLFPPRVVLVVQSSIIIPPSAGPGASLTC